MNKKLKIWTCLIFTLGTFLSKSVAQNIRKDGYIIADSTLKLDFYPKFPGGKNKLRVFTHEQLYNSDFYNKKIHRKPCKGYIYIRYTIDTLGKAQNFKINFNHLYFDTKNFKKEDSNELINEMEILMQSIFIKMPLWIPAHHHNNKVNVDIISPIIVN